MRLCDEKHLQKALPDLQCNLTSSAVPFVFCESKGCFMYKCISKMSVYISRLYIYIC